MKRAEAKRITLLFFIFIFLLLLLSVFHKTNPLVRIPFHAPSESLFWEHPAGAPQHTCLPQGVMQELYDKHALSLACPGVYLNDTPVDRWPMSAFSVLQKASVSELLAADARSHDVCVGRSSVPGGGRGVFAERRFAAGESVVPFFGLVVYDDLIDAAMSKDPAAHHTTYGAGTFFTTARDWGQRAVEVVTACRFWEGGGVAQPRPFSYTVLKEWQPDPLKSCSRPIWVVPAPYCAAGMVNDPRCVTRDAREQVPPGKKRTANVEMVQLWDPVLMASQVTLPGALFLVATVDIEVGSELFFDYGGEYEQFV